MSHQPARQYLLPYNLPSVLLPNSVFCPYLWADVVWQHCQRTVDEDTFQKMLERQVEVLRKERARGVEEAHRPPRAEDPPTEAPAATPSNAGDDTPLPNHSEVSPSDAHRV